MKIKLGQSQSNLTPNLLTISDFFSDNNKSLAPSYDIGWKFFDTMVKNHIWQYNYTLNPDGIFGAIKYMYTYYPDPNNRSHIREEFINVRTFEIKGPFTLAICKKLASLFRIRYWLPRFFSQLSGYLAIRRLDSLAS